MVPARAGTQVGEDVAEEVAAHHHVEPVRMADEVGGEDVDVELVGVDVGILRGERREALVPEGHGVDDAVRLRGGGEAARRAAPRELEGVAHHAVHAAPGEDALLHRHLVLGAREQAPSDLRVLALVVLAHHVEVDLLRTASRERRSEALQAAHRAQIDVLLEVAANRDEQPPQGDVIRYSGKAHRAQEDGVAAGNGPDAVRRHHAALARVVLAAPGVLVPVKGDPEAAAGRLEHPLPFRHHLPADSVPRDCRDPKLLHRHSLRSRERDPNPRRLPLVVEVRELLAGSGRFGQVTTGSSSTGRGGSVKIP